MWAIFKETAQAGFRLKKCPIPTIRDNEVLIEILHSSICGTDRHIYHWDSWAQAHLTPPVIIGHEFVGKICQVGQAVIGLKIGDRCTGEGHIGCDICQYCRTAKKHLCPNAKFIGITQNGSFAQYMSLPAKNVIKIPDHIPDEIASILDPLGNAVHCTLAFDLLGEDILISGAGPIGLMTTQIAKTLKTGRVVVLDPNPSRCAIAKNCGADYALPPKDKDLESLKRQLNIPEGFGIGFEMSGSPLALPQLVRHTAPGGKIGLLGLPNEASYLKTTEVILKGLQIRGFFGRKLFKTWYKMMALLEYDLGLSHLITHRFSFFDFEQAFALMDTHSSGKIILSWPKEKI